mmetsp:Transcript_8346/g.27739  ORF Transcript_8346/g.27739 Transcript_8346/m.27739 type:complete len:168 (+) Transcript_8346:804-1307(+)
MEEEEEEEDLENMGRGRRRRVAVDYAKLNEELFGDVECYEGEMLNDESPDWEMGMRSPTTPCTPATPLSPAPKRKRKSPDSEDKKENPGGSAKKTSYKRLPEGIPKFKPDADMLATLRASFEKDPKPDKAERERLAQQFGCAVQQVTIWFGNARQRSKKANTDDAGA